MLETCANFCSLCGEGILSDEEVDRLDGLSAAFRREVDGRFIHRAGQDTPS